MNLRLHLIFPISMLLLFAVATTAQTTPRTNSGKTQTSLAPASSKPRMTTSAPKSSERSAKTTTTTDRTSAGNESERPSRSTGLRPSETSLRNSNTGRPPSLSNTSRQQATKSAYRPAKKVQPLKPVEKVNVQWLTLEQALEKSKTEKRKIFVDVYTDWCGWCKHMDSTTFVTPAVARYLNDHYYAVKLNAEQTQDIVFKDKTYHFKKTGSRGYHELAALWLNNRLSFPTVVFDSTGTGVPGCHQDGGYYQLFWL
jgi:thioredoxin-related protein